MYGLIYLVSYRDFPTLIYFLILNTLHFVFVFNSVKNEEEIIFLFSTLKLNEKVICFN